MIDGGGSFDLGIALNENAANSNKRKRKTFDIGFNMYLVDICFAFLAFSNNCRDKFRIWAKVIASMVDGGGSFDPGLALNENAANSNKRKTFNFGLNMYLVDICFACLAFSNTVTIQ